MKKVEHILRTSSAYGVSSRDYLARAKKTLRRGTSADLFYAAFELRCGIEARLQQYLECQSHISRKKKDGWRIPEIGRTMDNVFRDANKCVRWAFHESHSGELLIALYYTPVGPGLQKSGQKLGNYLHSMKVFRPPEDPWWQMFRSELEGVSMDLETANRGTLLGPPLTKGGDGGVDINMEIPPGEDSDVFFKRLFNRAVEIKIAYFDSIPDQLEPEAHTWKTSRNLRRAE